MKKVMSNSVHYLLGVIGFFIWTADRQHTLGRLFYLKRITLKKAKKDIPCYN